MNQLAEVLDRPEPAMAVSFTKPTRARAIRAIAAVADVAELRADKFPFQDPAYLARQAKRLSALPVLLTIRHPEEGGEDCQMTEDAREWLFRQLLPAVDGVDIELAANIAQEVIDAAHAAGKVAIASSHDFTGTPTMDQLEELLAFGQKLEADGVKIAGQINTAEDDQRLKDFTRQHANDNVITVGMGKTYGPDSRIYLPSHGSQLTYASAGRVAIAPGQMDYMKTHERLMQADPDYAALFAY